MLDQNIENARASNAPNNGIPKMSPENQSNLSEEAQKSLSSPLGGGYTIDEEGVLNRYAIEPPVSEASYPSSKEQRRYLFLGIAAVLFIALILEIAFVAS